MIIKILITGYCILLCAIIANIIANFILLDTWYNFIEEILKSNLKNAVKSLDIIDIIWLFFIYPICLSTGYLLGEKIYKIFVV